MFQIAPVVVLLLLSLSVPDRSAAQATTTAARPRAAAAVGAADVSIRGTVVTPGGWQFPNSAVRARNLLTGNIGGSTTAQGGHFQVAGLSAGSYVLEALDPAGRVIGTSPFIAAVAGTTVTTTVTVTSALIAAAESERSRATLTTTAAETVKFAAAAAGVAGVVAPGTVVTASPSR